MRMVVACFHFVQDELVFGFMAIGAITPGGG
jgi:hypothetical protein